jgi:hypothetical protein
MTDQPLAPQEAQPPEKKRVETNDRDLAALGMDTLWSMAGRLALSDIIPKEMQGKQANCYMVCVWAKENDVPIIQAMQNTMVVNGRLSVWGDLLLAMVQRSPHYIRHEEFYEGKEGTDSYTAVSRFWRRGCEKPYEGRFSIAQAKTAHLWAKNVWATYPERMLKMRARTFAARDGFSDALKGITSVEEAQDIRVRDVHAEVVEEKKPELQAGSFNFGKAAFQRLPEPQSQPVQSDGDEPPADMGQKGGGEMRQEQLPLEESMTATTDEPQPPDPESPSSDQNQGKKLTPKERLRAEIDDVVEGKDLDAAVVEHYVRTALKRASLQECTQKELAAVLMKLSSEPELFMKM